MVSKKKLFFYSLFFSLMLLIVFNWTLIRYGYGQLKGQLHVINNSEEISEVLKQDNFPDSLKLKLQLIQEVKAFTEDELGLKKTNNYETVFNQQGKPILWLVTASEKYKLEEYTWSFPLLGEVGYKGFFEIEKAEEEKKKLIEAGYDTDIREVMAWSTLGWFRDPVLTNFLSRPDYQLINLIIHELTHSTLYLPDSVTFNENFANFVAHEGTLLFLRKHKPSLLQDYVNYHHDDSLYTSIVLATAEELGSFYEESEGKSVEEKEKRKTEIISKGILLLKSGAFLEKENYTFSRFEKEPPNNTYFLSFIRYESKQEYFVSVYVENNQDIKAFMKCLIDANSN